MPKKGSAAPARSGTRSRPRATAAGPAAVRAALTDLRPIDDLAAIFASLGSAPRLRLLYLLYHRPDLRVGELAELTGLTVSGVSTHLKKLRDAGLVTCRREKQAICCALPVRGDHVRFLGQLFREIAEESGCCCC